MFFKITNNLISFNKLVFMLLIFNTYFRITKLDVLFLSIIQCIIAIKKAINEIHKYTAF